MDAPVTGRFAADEPRDDSWASQGPVIARNALWFYAATGVNLALGIVMLPFNLHHLGASAYGLWMLTVSLTTYFSILDFGYGHAQVKYAARYRAARDVRALNEVASTLFFILLGVALLAYAVAFVLSGYLHTLFALTPDQTKTARIVLLTVSARVALSFPFSVFGGLTSGFQAHAINHVASIGINILAALANVIVLTLGYGLVELVAATTVVHLAGLLVFRRTAYRVFPALHIGWRHVRWARVQEVTGFSSALLVIDLATKVNYMADSAVIGMFLGPAAIAAWAVGSRLYHVIRSLTRVLAGLLFPAIVESASRDRPDRMRTLLIQGTRLSLAMVIPLAAVSGILAQVIVLAWVGPGFGVSALVFQILAAVATVKVGTLTASQILKGAERHRFLAGCKVVTATANLTLSIIFVQWWGLVGVALGTLLPWTLMSWGVIFPAACRRADLPLASAWRTAVWPALWPAVPTAALVYGVVQSMHMHVAVIVASVAVAALLYAFLFLRFAVPPRERSWYQRQIMGLLRRPRILMPGSPAGQPWNTLATDARRSGTTATPVERSSAESALGGP